jgi:hypothetical protein
MKEKQENKKQYSQKAQDPAPQSKEEMKKQNCKEDNQVKSKKNNQAK